jgi:EmrB/QacA subfamily drug resistance transporter
MTRKQKGWMLVALGLGTFMSALDSSVVNIAVPTIQTHFGVSMADVEWVITAYLLVISSVLLFFGRIADLYGHKTIYIVGFVVFTIGSGLCSLAGSIGMLIVCRIFQALGAGMMFSANSAIVTHNVAPASRGKAFSVISIAVAAALSAGPVLGGVLTTTLGWQSIFYINLPVGVVGTLLAIKYIPKSGGQKGVKLDIPGSALIFAALLLILMPLNQLAYGIDPLPFWAMLGAGIALFVGFLIVEKRTKHPMLDLKLFKNRVFSAGLLAAILSFMGQFTMVFLSPFYLQQLRGLTPAGAGLLNLPQPLASLLIAPLAGYLTDRIDTRILSSAGLGVSALGLFLLSFLGIDTPFWFFGLVIAVCGIGGGMFQTPNNSAVMGNVPSHSRGIASGMLSTARNMGMVLGVALSGALFSVFSGMGAKALAAQGITGDALSRQTFVFGLHYTYIAAAVLVLCGMAASLTKGKVLTGRELAEQQQQGE